MHGYGHAAPQPYQSTAHPAHYAPSIEHDDEEKHAQDEESEQGQLQVEDEQKEGKGQDEDDVDDDEDDWQLQFALFEHSTALLPSQHNAVKEEKETEDDEEQTDEKEEARPSNRPVRARVMHSTPAVPGLRSPQPLRVTGAERQFGSFIHSSRSRYELYNRVHQWRFMHYGRPLTGNMAELVEWLSAQLPFATEAEAEAEAKEAVSSPAGTQLVSDAAAVAIDTQHAVTMTGSASPLTGIGGTCSGRKRRRSSVDSDDSGNGSSESSNDSNRRSSLSSSNTRNPSSPASSTSSAISSPPPPAQRNRRPAGNRRANRHNIIHSGYLDSPNWRHTAGHFDFPFPTPPVFIFRHRVGPSRVSFESFGFPDCARCRQPFSSPSNSEAHYEAAVHAHVNPTFVRYDEATGRWEWFKRARRGPNNKRQ